MMGLISALRGQPATTSGDNLARALRITGKLARQRALVVVISDFRDEDGWQRPMRRLALHHSTVAVEINDPRERELPAVGPVQLRDLETGRRRLVDTADPRFQRRFAAVVAESDRAREALLARAGARHLIVETGVDWVATLARGLGRPRLRRSGRL
jgi:hypothetical protein